MRSCIFSLLLVAVVGTSALGDVVSGPFQGDDVPPLKAFVVVGEPDQQSVNLGELRLEKPTIYFFVSANMWSRPVARLLKSLDEQIAKLSDEAVICFVYLTDDVPVAKDYLPKPQMSLKLEHTWWTVYEGDQVGPGEWGLHSDADCTVVITTRGKVRFSTGYTSANSTLTDAVLKEFRRALTGE